MFKNDRTLKILIICILALSLFTSQLVYANINNGYKTVEAKLGDYIEKGGVNNAEVTLLRNDSLTIDDPQGTLVEYLVASGQAVKKGDSLLSYQIPSDSISLEEKKLMLQKNQKTYQRTLEKKESDITESLNKLQTMDGKSIEAQIFKLSIQKMQLEYEQYVYQTMKGLDELKFTIEDLESAMVELQYIYAPYDGIIYINDNIKVGMDLNPSMSLIYIVDTNSAVLSAPVSGVNKLWYDLEVSVTGINNRQADTSKIMDGKVIAADSLLNGKASTGMVYIKIENGENLLIPGQKANITTDAVIVKNVLMIPLSVVKSDNDMRYVYISDRNGELRKQYIMGRDNGTDMWVYNGLSKGQQIVKE